LVWAMATLDASNSGHATARAHARERLRIVVYTEW